MSLTLRKQNFANDGLSTTNMRKPDKEIISKIMKRHEPLKMEDPNSEHLTEN